MASINNLIEYLLEDDAVPFIRFAFGEFYPDISKREFVSLWNHHHKKDLTLLKNAKPEEDLHKMIVLWKYSKKFIPKNRYKDV